MEWGTNWVGNPQLRFQNNLKALDWPRNSSTRNATVKDARKNQGMSHYPIYRGGYSTMIPHIILCGQFRVPHIVEGIIRPYTLNQLVHRVPSLGSSQRYHRTDGSRATSRFPLVPDHFWPHASLIKKGCPATLSRSRANDSNVSTRPLSPLFERGTK